MVISGLNVTSRSRNGEDWEVVGSVGCELVEPGRSFFTDLRTPSHLPHQKNNTRPPGFFEELKLTKSH